MKVTASALLLAMTLHQLARADDTPPIDQQTRDQENNSNMEDSGMNRAKRVFDSRIVSTVRYSSGIIVNASVILMLNRDEIETKNQEEISYFFELFQGVLQLQKYHRQPSTKPLISIATRLYFCPPV